MKWRQIFCWHNWVLERTYDDPNNPDKFIAKNYCVNCGKGMSERLYKRVAR